MATEPIQAGPYPGPSDPPDGATEIKAVVDWAAPRLNMRFATTAARDAAIPTPTEGMECVTGTGATLIKWTYVGTGWSRGPGAWVQRGASVVAPDANGNAQIIFPTPFAVVPIVVAMNGNYLAPTPTIAVQGTNTVTTTSAYVHLVNTTTGASWTGAAVQVNWVAVGA